MCASNNEKQLAKCHRREIVVATWYIESITFLSTLNVETKNKNNVFVDEI